MLLQSELDNVHDKLLQASRNGGAPAADAAESAMASVAQLQQASELEGLRSQIQILQALDQQRQRELEAAQEEIQKARALQDESVLGSSGESMFAALQTKQLRSSEGIRMYEQLLRAKEWTAELFAAKQRLEMELRDVRASLRGKVQWRGSVADKRAAAKLDQSPLDSTTGADDTLMSVFADPEALSFTSDQEATRLSDGDNNAAASAGQISDLQRQIVDLELQLGKARAWAKEMYSEADIVRRASAAKAEKTVSQPIQLVINLKVDQETPSADFPNTHDMDVRDTTAASEEKQPQATFSDLVASTLFGGLDADEGSVTCSSLSSITVVDEDPTADLKDSLDGAVAEVSALREQLAVSEHVAAERLARASEAYAADISLAWSRVSELQAIVKELQAELDKLNENRRSIVNEIQISGSPLQHVRSTPPPVEVSEAYLPTGAPDPTGDEHVDSPFMSFASPAIERALRNAEERIAAACAAECALEDVRAQIDSREAAVEEEELILRATQERLLLLGIGIQQRAEALRDAEQRIRDAKAQLEYNILILKRQAEEAAKAASEARGVSQQLSAATTAFEAR